MFREIFEEHEAAFHAKQSALIKSIGGGLDALIISMQAVDETSYGEPPYIVFDGEDALLLVDGEGKCSCLPSHFIMPGDSVRQGSDAIRIDVNGEAMLFIPANKDYEFPVMPSGVSVDLDVVYMGLIDNLFEVYTESALSLSKQYIAKRLVYLQQALRDISEESEMTLHDLMETQKQMVFGSVLTMFNESVSRASNRVVEIFEEQADGNESGDE